MPIIQIQNRKPTNQLGDLLTTLYDVLLLCETEEKLISNSTKASKWVQFVKSNQVSLIYNHDVTKGVFKSQKIDNTEHLVIDGTYAKQEINNTIVFVHKQKRYFKFAYI